MLTWQIEAGRANARSLEYNAIMLKPIERLLELVEGLRVMDIPSHYVTKFVESAQGAQYIGRYVTLKSGDINLCIGHQVRNTHVNIDIPSSRLSSRHPSTV
jgi:hypothetical protein